jgi:2-polyprenyl-6-methoxyphenol hydroxylase-like FAD-dependent oxidoreductase
VTYDRSGTGAVFGLAIHRASLFDAVLQAARAAGASLVPSHRVACVESGHVHFEGGAVSDRFDLVVDATGAGSDLSAIETKPLPYGAIWSTVPWPDATDLPMDQLSQTYRRADRMIGALPCGTLPGSDQPQAAIFWTMARYAHGTLRKPFGDRLAIIGDSAHRASPQLGQGANMALLDAMALAQALTYEANIQVALLNYARARRWHVWTYQAMSWAFTPQYQSDSKWLPKLRDRVLFPASQIPPVPRVLTRLVCGTLLPPLGSLSLR